MTTATVPITRQRTCCASRPRHASERTRRCRSHDRASGQVRAPELRPHVGGRDSSKSTPSRAAVPTTTTTTTSRVTRSTAETSTARAAGAAFAVGACIASVGCGVALGGIAVGHVFAAGMLAHGIVGTRQQRGRDGGRWAASIASATAKGVACGAAFRRGCLGAAGRGPKAGAAVSGGYRAVGRWFMRHLW